MGGFKSLLGTFWVWFYRPVGGVLILIALLSVTLGVVASAERDDRIERAFAAAGMRTISAPVDEIYVAPFDPRMVKAGLPTGRLFAVNGVPIGPMDAENPRILEIMTAQPGQPIAMTIVQRDGVWKRAVVERGTMGQTPYWQILLHSLFEIAGGLAIWAALFLLFIRRPRDRVSVLIVLGLLVGAIIYWPPFDLGLDMETRDAIGILGALAFMIGILMFPSGRLRIALPIIVGMIVLITIAEQIGITGDIFIFTIPAAVVLFRFWRMPPGIERQQLKWGALGLAGMALFQLLDTLATSYADATVDPGTRAAIVAAGALADQLGNVSFAAGMLIALLRFRLYDAEAVITRSAAYAVLTVLLVAAFAAAEKVLELMGEGVFGGVAAEGIAAAIAATLIAPMHDRITGWAEARFQRALIRLRREVPPRVSDMRSTADIEGIGALVTEAAAEATRARAAAMTLDGDVIAVHAIDRGEAIDWFAGWNPPETGDIDRDPNDPLFPLRIALEADGPGRVGWLLLARRPDGSGFGKDEREALMEIADPVARALAVARERKAREAEQAALAQSLNARIDALETALRRLAPSAAPG